MIRIVSILFLFITILSGCGHKKNYATVSTYAGNGEMGMRNGKRSDASFANLMGIAADNKGNLFIADSHNNMIRKIDADGNVSTFAGSGEAGSIDGKGIAATFFYPTGIAVDKNGNVFVADTHNNLIRKINPDGVVTTIAGRRGTNMASTDSVEIKFDNPAGIAAGNDGNIYVADMINDVIRKIFPDNKVTILAGRIGDRGSKNGDASSATFYLPWGIAVDSTNNVYVSDMYNNMIRKISADGIVTTIAGQSKRGNTDGKDTAASFFHPAGIAIDPKGILFVADMGNNKIRKISPDGIVTTIAGNGSRGKTNGRDTVASFNKPYSIAVGIDGVVYVGDYQNNLVRKIVF